MGLSDPAADALLGTPAALRGERIPRLRDFDWEIIDPAEIQYIFVAREDLGKIVFAPWTAALHFMPGQIYLRATRNVYETPYRSLIEVVAKLDARFKRVHVSVLANVRAVRWARLKRGRARLGFLIDQQREEVTVSERHVKELRGYFQPPSSQRGEPRKAR